MNERIYLDYAASTPLRPEVLEAMRPFLSGAYNPSAAHAEGRAARKALDAARERVAACLGAKPKEIVFTGGGTEADNLALTGCAHAPAAQRRHLVASAIEHHAILHVLDALADRGFTRELVPAGADGIVDARAFEAALDRAPALLASVMLVNNELGTVQPIAQLASAAHARGTLLHTDAVQAAAYLPLDVRELGVDLLSLAAHKVEGPKGTGALYVREGTPLAPIIFGGGQESGKRAGTENVAGIVGFAAALELASAGRAQAAAHVGALRDAFEAQVLARIPEVRVNGAGAPRAPHVSNLSFAGAPSEQLLVRLDLDGVAVSAGSACASGAVEPSHVVAAIGLETPWSEGVIRFSFGRTSTQGEVRRAVEILERAVQDVRSAASRVLSSKMGNSWFTSGA